jgi:hypothetical protein
VATVDFLVIRKDYSMAPFSATVDTAIMGRKSLDAGFEFEDERRQAAPLDDDDVRFLEL